MVLMRRVAQEAASLSEAAIFESLTLTPSQKTKNIVEASLCPISTLCVALHAAASFRVLPQWCGSARGHP